ncbi:hypothetical protein PtB15_1B525 [Puccinia triticina]|nr:hypothetical protein PtB15_1B525 [Puccinia triticina]
MEIVPERRRSHTQPADCRHTPQASQVPTKLNRRAHQPSWLIQFSLNFVTAQSRSLDWKRDHPKAEARRQRAEPD